MLKGILIAIILTVGQSVLAAPICDQAEKMAKSVGLANALTYYESCALSVNNDAAQAALAAAYSTGKGAPKNMQKALLFYHLSAENGNAQSQTQLAQLLLKLDETAGGRQEVQSYLRKIGAALKNQPENDFKGEMLHPYTLLLLAAEKPDQKWYYASNVLTSNEAVVLLKGYKIQPAKRSAALKDASSWKMKKMMQAAQEVLPSADYTRFVNAVKPAKGKADAFSRNQAIKNLQTRIKEYKEN